MDIWQDRAKNDENYSSVIDPKDKSGLKAAYMKIVHEGAIKSFIKEIKPGEKVLDFGCGTGRILEYDLFLNADYYGVDISSGMIKNARQKWENRPHTNLYVYNGTLLPFEHETFDYVISTWVFQHIVEDNKLEELITELAKLHRPKGALLFIEQIRNNEYVEMLEIAEINYNLVPGVSNGFFYRIMSVLRIGLMKGLVPLFVSMDKLIYRLIFARSAFMRKFYIGKKWIDCIYYCKQ